MQLERWRYSVPLRLRGLFRRGRLETDLTDEFRDHLERDIEARIAQGEQHDDHVAAAFAHESRSRSGADLVHSEATLRQRGRKGRVAFSVDARRRGPREPNQFSSFW
jgi:hypothetical protein